MIEPIDFLSRVNTSLPLSEQDTEVKAYIEHLIEEVEPLIGEVTVFTPPFDPDVQSFPWKQAYSVTGGTLEIEYHWIDSETISHISLNKQSNA